MMTRLLGEKRALNSRNTMLLEMGKVKLEYNE